MCKVIPNPAISDSQHPSSHGTQLFVLISTDIHYEFHRLHVHALKKVLYDKPTNAHSLVKSHIMFSGSWFRTSL